MSGIFGILNLNTTDNQRTFVNTVGQRIVYDAINELLTRYNAGLRAAMAYMTMADLDRHLRTIFIQNTNTVRYEILKALVNNTQRTFKDPLHGDLLVEPLANGDSVTYPPVLGSEDEATDDHYLESGYAAADISDTNNPFVTIRDELEEHFGAATGGENIVVFINSAQTAKVEALADFDEAESEPEPEPEKKPAAKSRAKK